MDAILTAGVACGAILTAGIAGGAGCKSCPFEVHHPRRLFHLLYGK